MHGIGLKEIVDIIDDKVIVCNKSVRKKEACKFSRMGSNNARKINKKCLDLLTKN